MRSRTLLTTVALLGVAALTLTACSGESAGNETSGEASGTERHSVTVGIIPVAEFNTVYIAQDQGFFDEVGLDVQIEVQSNAASIVPSVMNGQLTFGTAATPPFLVAAEQGLPVRAIANAANTADSAEADTGAIVVAADSAITTLEDLEGKIVATNALSSLPHVAAAAQLAEAGVDIDAVQFVAMPFPDMQGALEQGRVDALLSVEPFMTAALSAGGVSLSPMYADVYESGTTHTLFFTSQAFLEESPEVVEKFQEAIAKANAFVAADDTELRQALITYGKMSEEVASTVKLPVYNTEFNVPGIEYMASLMVDTGFISSVPDVSTFFIQK